jgi:4-hydroxybenzoate polyprenyltransferase
VAFCLCASAVYVLNDLIDLRSDRAHPRKKQRSFAAGRLSPLHGICAIPVLLLVALAVAATVSRQFVLILLTYLALTTAYSFYLKRKLLVDIVVLSVLYTVRIFAGGVAIGVAISNWLAMFSLFFFTALALIKRYTELAVRRDAQLGKPAGRNYELDDLPVLGVLSAAAGLNAITIFTLYISSANVTALYRRPEALWLIAPLLLYWFARMLVMAHRRHLDDDPIVFAVRDRISLLTLACIIGLVIVAI